MQIILHLYMSTGIVSLATRTHQHEPISFAISIYPSPLTRRKNSGKKNKRILTKIDILGGVLQLVGMFRCGVKPDKSNGNCISVGEPFNEQQTNRS
jgi:hypothetical protein